MFGGKVIQSDVGASFVVVCSPSFDSFLGAVKRQETIFIETFRSDVSMKDSMNALSVGFPGLQESSVSLYA